MGDRKTISPQENKFAARVPKKAGITDDNDSEAIVIDPKHVIAYVNLALYYQKEGMIDETIAVLDKGLAAVPGNEILLMMRKDAEKSRDSGGNAIVMRQRVADC